MPLYPGPNKAALLHENQQAFLFQNSIIVAGQASLAVQLARTPGRDYPFGCSFEVSFGADPVAFRVDIQTSDSDNAASFVTISSLTGGLNASFVGRVELPAFWAKYVRAVLVSITTNQAITVKVSR